MQTPIACSHGEPRRDWASQSVPAASYRHTCRGRNTAGVTPAKSRCSVNVYWTHKGVTVHFPHCTTTCLDCDLVYFPGATRSLPDPLWASALDGRGGVSVLPLPGPLPHGVMGMIVPPPAPRYLSFQLGFLVVFPFVPSALPGASPHREAYSVQGHSGSWRPPYIDWQRPRWYLVNSM